MDITTADPSWLTVLADIAARCQADAERYVAYVSEEPDAIVADIAGVGDWTAVTWVMRSGREITGWLLGETDDELGRVWWWGPFVSDPMSWQDVADVLYRRANEALGRFPQQEMVADARSSKIPAFAERHLFHRDEASLLLVRTLDDAWPLFHEIDEATVDDHPAIVSLHDQLFPGTHTSGRALVAKTGLDRILLTAHDGVALAGYMAAELQNDGSLYIDFVGVAPEHAGRGFGRKLVSTACKIGSERGAARVHLSVRESNETARALYASLQFVEERMVVPYRKGFSLQ